MTTSQLYPIILELVFGKSCVVNVTVDDLMSRKILGPMLHDLLEETGLKTLKVTTKCWHVLTPSGIKYLTFIIGPCPFTRNSSSTTDIHLGE